MPSDALDAKERKACVLPGPIVDNRFILECGFEITEEGELPFEVLARVRSRHGVVVTGLGLPLARRGNACRTYTLMHGRTG